MRDKAGNIYAWDASLAIHENILGKLGLKPEDVGPADADIWEFVRGRLQSTNGASAARLGGKSDREVARDAQQQPLRWLAGQKAGPRSLKGNKGHPATIASRQPTAKGSSTDIYAQPSLAAMKLSPKNFEQDMALFKNADAYPNFCPDELSGTPDEIARKVIDHIKSNLRFLYENTSDVIRENGHLWYNGARKIVDEKVAQYGLNDASVTGVYAALSPQKQWDINVYLGDAVIDIYQTKQNDAWDDEMEAWKQIKSTPKLDKKTGKMKADLDATLFEPVRGAG